MNAKWQWLIRIGAIALLAGAALHGYSTYRAIADARERLTDKARLLTQLVQLEADLSTFTAAREVYASAAAAPTADLAALLRNTGLTYRDNRLQDVPAVPPGWTLHRREVAFHEAPLSQVMAFVDTAQAARPPWRPVEVDIRASAHTPGVGQVVLVLETVERVNRQP